MYIIVHRKVRKKEGQFCKAPFAPNSEEEDVQDSDFGQEKSPYRD